MASVKFTPNGEENKEYELRNPLLFTKNDDGDKKLQFQTPIHKKDGSKEFELKSPITTEDKDGEKEVKFQSPIEMKEDDKSSKLTIRNR